jgi:acetyl esterase/lipase
MKKMKRGKFLTEYHTARTTRRNGRRRVLRVVLCCLLLLMPPVFLAWLIDLWRPGWILVGALFIAGIWLLVKLSEPRVVRVEDMRFIKRRRRKVFFAGVLIGLYAVVVLFRPDPAVSFAGTVVREGIRMVVQSPMVDGGLLGQGDKMQYGSRWQVPEGYANTRIQLETCAVEWLQQVSPGVEPGQPIRPDAEPGQPDNQAESPDATARQTERVVYQLHGGGYVYGFFDMYRDFAMRWSKLVGGAAVVSLDYRIAPAHTHPAALEDALQGWDFLMAQGYLPENILVVGDSAGGNLTLALGLALRDKKMDLPGAMVVMSPWADLSAKGPSHLENIYRDPMFGVPKGTPLPEKALPPVYAGSADLTDPWLSPVYGEFHGFPDMLIQVGTEEVLLSDSRTVHEKALAAGGAATLTGYPGMFHMVQLFRDVLPESRAAWREAGAFVSSHFLE